MKLSIIQSVIRDPSEYEPIFYHSFNIPMPIELIIIDSDWSKERKEQIELIHHGFKQVVYAPAKEKNSNLKYDFLSAHNTGLAYAEGELCMLMGGRNELHPEFFNRLNETIDNFGVNIAIRPVELEANNGDKKWVTYVKYPERYFILPAQPLGFEGLRAVLQIQTCGFLIMNRSRWYEINGLDERYDVGCKWWDNELLDRLYNAKINVIVDQKLLIYRFPHMSAQPPEYDAECKKIYDETKQEKNIRADNTFDISSHHDEYMEKKKDYIL